MTERGRGGPQRLGDVIAQLFAKRAIVGPLETDQLHRIWAEVSGPAWSSATRVMMLKDDVLIVEVQSSSLLFELNNFHKTRLIDALRQQPPLRKLRTLRFQSGST
ncbi:MAG: DUF721 domain-containing protein [Planctomycetota bacterium]